MIRIVHPGSGSGFFLPIPDIGSRGQKGTGSRIRICNTEFDHKIVESLDPDLEPKLDPH
jgi:hypothetical protein